jgi:molybdopterin-guanine dinucleotide biosynthesis protein A
MVIGQNADEFGLKSAKDIHSEWGALGGVHAALATCRADWALITACDLPFVSGELFARMISVKEQFDAVAPIQKDGFPQPLCALYRVNPCLDTAQSLISSGERRPVQLLNQVKTRWITFEELGDLPGADHFFDNINTPEDFDRAQQKGVSFQARG